MVAAMEANPTLATRPALILNRPKLDELRRANGINTEQGLAKIIGVRVETLWRASKGDPVSGAFVARVKLAFPHASMDSLFEVSSVEAVAS